MAKFLVDMMTGDGSQVDPLPDDGKDPAAVALGRKGGQARAKTLSQGKRSEIAKRAAKARCKQSD